MFILGHMGLGSKLVSPWASGLPRRWLLLGTLLPDLIDKPLYYGLSWATGLVGNDLGLISGTRTFGHTALLLLVISLVAYFRRSPVFAAIALGAATHLALDGVFDGLRGTDVGQSLLPALLWPFVSMHFPVATARSMGEHFWNTMSPVIIWGEVAGGLLLMWSFWKSSHKVEILEFIRARRTLRVERRKRRRHSQSFRR